MLGVVAINQTAGNSNMKYYRTRLEVRVIEERRRAHPHYFSPDFRCIVFLYGMPGGWKEQILLDLKRECSHFLYLPDLVGAKKASALVDRIFSSYRHRWEQGSADAPEYVENAVAADGLTTGSIDSDIIEILRAQLQSKSHSGKLTTHADERKTSAELHICAPFRSRIRQGLSLVSLFSNDEIGSFEAVASRPFSETLDPAAEEFIRRAMFLDLGELVPVRSIGSSVRYRMNLRQSIGKDSGELSRADVSKPDFASWRELPKNLVMRTLDLHRSRPLASPTVFASGALDQSASNWRSYCDVLTNEIPRLLRAIRSRLQHRVEQVIKSSSAIEPCNWHPCHSIAKSWPLIELALSIVDDVSSQNDRDADFASVAIRSVAPTDGQKVAALAERLLAIDHELLSVEFDGVSEFCGKIRESALPSLLGLQRPRAFVLENRASWINSVYRGITTNKTHNPCSGPASEWLKARYEGFEWFGWPEKRSAAISKLFSSFVGRIQWQFIGVDQANYKALFAEVRSITENNWGNKSKELLDRCRETRDFFAGFGDWRVHLVCVLDGDFTSAARDELIQSAAFDEVWSAREVVLRWGEMLELR